MIFFGESLPRRFFECQHKDLNLKNEIDLILIMGTSMSVFPVAGYFLVFTLFIVFTINTMIVKVWFLNFKIGTKNVQLFSSIKH